MSTGHLRIPGAPEPLSLPDKHSRQTRRHQTMLRERAGRFGLPPWNPMRFGVNNGSSLRHILRMPASDWPRRSYLPDRRSLIGPRETMACVNSPRALAGLTQHTVPFVSQGAALTAAARLVREHTGARRCGLTRNYMRLEAEFSSRKQRTPSVPPNIQTGATQGPWET